ncbi:hypothetical protein RHSIM_RhsimUnG0099500 [Rhododendron simsii]|uniref:Uncharacterized protein n=1 Tax=Rhododendron simsii TaxID=118357 RepID=A0A834G1N1_RHOSS|nr:hypothetical protein RHSIM_RhsimUnG0099500 [Rhododendron simsii]
MVWYLSGYYPWNVKAVKHMKHRTNQEETHTVSISLVHLIKLCKSYYLSIFPPCPYLNFFDDIAVSHVHIFLCLSTCVLVFMVKDGSRHAVNSIQQTSNSLFLCELHEIIHARAEVIGESAKIDMLLKAKRGDKEEKRKSLGTQEQ